MPKENGLKRVYRFGGIGISNMIFRFSKKINPNLITISGFIVYLLGAMQYVIALLLNEIYLLTNILFVVTIQFALFIDYADGEYARRVNKTSKKGHYLDGMLDLTKISITYFLIYFSSNNEPIKIVLFISSLLFIIVRFSNRNVKSQNSAKDHSNNGKFLTISLILGFSVVHQFLYFSLYLLFGMWQILILPIAMGLLLFVRNSIKIFKTPENLE